MTISLLHIVVPTILILVVLILYINSSKKQMIAEIKQLKTQLEKLDNVPEPPVENTAAENADISAPVAEPEVQEEQEKIEEQDEPVQTNTETGASGYNTGKSGKIYTKEELELLIRE